MAVAASFLAGASSRLLPASIPFRFFGAAVVFHVVAWLAALAGADAMPSFAGGLGWPLAALHAATLGVLAMIAIGASLQLLPVATRRPVAGARIAAAIFWTYVPGVAALVAGMGLARPALLGAGAVAVVAGLAAFGVLLARNLVAARGMPLVTAHGVVAVTALAVMLSAAIALVASYALGAAVSRPSVVALHVVLAGYGFMGMLALGLAYLLVPMFALAEAPPAHRGWASFALAALALAFALPAALGVLPDVFGVAAAGLGAVAALLHVGLMREALARGLRRELGPGVALMRIGWASLLASLALALALALDAPVPRLATLFALALDAPAPRLATLFALALYGGWLLSFALGVLQKIVPFLAAMHAARGQRRPPTPSSMTAALPLRLHLRLHAAGLALLAAAIVADSGPLAAAGAAAGAAGALAYAAFFAAALRRMIPVMETR